MWSGNGPQDTVSVGVERKTLMDLLSSIATGRLSGHQMIGLTNEFDFVYLLVEGLWRPDRESGVLMRSNMKGRWVQAKLGQRKFMARDIFNYLNTLAIMCNVITIQTANKWESARWLDANYSWWNKKWANHKSHLQFQEPVVNAHLVRPNIVTRVASQFDGIGWDKARKLGEKFSFLQGFMEANFEELTEVEGIGDGIAQSIIDQRG